MIATIILKNLVSFYPFFVLLLETKNFHQVDGLVTRNISVFCL